MLACLVTQSYLTLCHPIHCSPPGFSVHGILQARTLEWVAISSSRESSQPRDWTHVSCVSFIDRQVLYLWSHWGRPSYTWYGSKESSVFLACDFSHAWWYTPHVLPGGKGALQGNWHCHKVPLPGVLPSSLLTPKPFSSHRKQPAFFSFLWVWLLFCFPWDKLFSIPQFV